MSSSHNMSVAASDEDEEGALPDDVEEGVVEEESGPATESCSTVRDSNHPRGLGTDSITNENDHGSRSDNDDGTEQHPNGRLSSSSSRSRRGSNTTSSSSSPAAEEEDSLNRRRRLPPPPSTAGLLLSSPSEEEAIISSPLKNSPEQLLPVKISPHYLARRTRQAAVGRVSTTESTSSSSNIFPNWRINNPPSDERGPVLRDANGFSVTGKAYAALVARMLSFPELTDNYYHMAMKNAYDTLLEYAKNLGVDGAEFLKHLYCYYILGYETYSQLAHPAFVDPEPLAHTCAPTASKRLREEKTVCPPPPPDKLADKRAEKKKRRLQQPDAAVFGEELLSLGPPDEFHQSFSRLHKSEQREAFSSFRLDRSESPQVQQVRECLSDITLESEGEECPEPFSSPPTRVPPPPPPPPPPSNRPGVFCDGDGDDEKSLCSLDSIDDDQNRNSASRNPQRGFTRGGFPPPPPPTEMSEEEIQIDMGTRETRGTPMTPPRMSRLGNRVIASDESLLRLRRAGFSRFDSHFAKPFPCAQTPPATFLSEHLP